MPPEPQSLSTLEELRQEGVLQRSGDHYEVTRRWRAARHRASTARAVASENLDRGNPIVQALLESFGGRRAVSTLGAHVAILFALEQSDRHAGTAVSKP